MRFFRKRNFGITLLVPLSLLLSSCSESEDLATYNQKMVYTSMSNFKSQMLAKWDELLQVAPGTGQVLWDLGMTSIIDQSSGPLKNYWFDVTTDFCSNSPDTGLSFDFKAPCARHDFGWRNLQRLDRHWNCSNGPCISAPLGLYWTLGNRLNGNNIFYSDMEEHCASRAWTLRGYCRLTRDLYYTVVNIAAKVA